MMIAMVKVNLDPCTILGIIQIILGKLTLNCFGGNLMFRSKDFYLKKIYNTSGKKLGVVRDLYIDFNKGVIVGIRVTNYSLLNKKNYLDVSKIQWFDDDIIASELEEAEGLRFSEIKDLEVVDKSGNIKGEVEDILIDEQTYTITGLILGSGIVDKVVRGKEIILINKCVLGDDFILYIGEDGIVVRNIPSGIEKDAICKKA